MNCFPCFGQRNKKGNKDNESPHAQDGGPAPSDFKENRNVIDCKQKTESSQDVGNENVGAKTFNFRELAAATKNFRQECLVGEGGFGRVYKGLLPGNQQVVAVKQLDRNGMQGNKEFLNEILSLSRLQHQNLVNLIGYCADGDQRLLVYEYMSGGSLENRIHDNATNKKPLEWHLRMKIASGAAEGLEYLHDQANPIIYRDLKPSNVLLDEDLNPKLSDYGLAKLGPAGDSKFQVSSMGTYGYSAPEYTRNGEVSAKSDVYSFGVVLLELVTGRKVIDTTRPNEEQNLITWAQPIFKDPKRFPDMADPLLNKRFPEKDLNQVVAIAAMCLQEEPTVRPLISDVVTTLSFISKDPVESHSSGQDGSTPIGVPLPPSNLPEKCENEMKNSIKYQNDEKGSLNSVSSDYEDSSNAKLSRRESSGNSDKYNSNDKTQESESESESESDSSDDNSEYEDTGSIDEDADSGDDNEEAAKQSKRWQSRSSRKSSKKIQSGRTSSRYNNSSKSYGKNHSSSRKNSIASRSKKVNDEVVSVDHIDSKRSSYGSSSSGKSTNESFNRSKRFQDESASFGHKSGKGSYERRMSSTKSNRKSFGDRTNSKRSDDGSISPSTSSEGSFHGSEAFLDETFSIGHHSRKVPEDERVLLDQNSSKISHLDHNESIGS